KSDRRAHHRRARAAEGAPSSRSSQKLGDLREPDGSVALADTIVAYGRTSVTRRKRPTRRLCDTSSAVLHLGRLVEHARTRPADHQLARRVPPAASADASPPPAREPSPTAPRAAMGGRRGRLPMVRGTLGRNETGRPAGPRARNQKKPADLIGTQHAIPPVSD